MGQGDIAVEVGAEQSRATGWHPPERPGRRVAVAVVGAHGGDRHGRADRVEERRFLVGTAVVRDLEHRRPEVLALPMRSRCASGSTSPVSSTTVGPLWSRSTSELLFGSELVHRNALHAYPLR